MVDEKVDSVMEIGVDYLIGVDCGCLLNIGGCIECLGKEVKVMYIVEVLNSCLWRGNISYVYEN